MWQGLRAKAPRVPWLNRSFATTVTELVLPLSSSLFLGHLFYSFHLFAHFILVLPFHLSISIIASADRLLPVPLSLFSLATILSSPLIS